MLGARVINFPAEHAGNFPVGKIATGKFLGLAGKFLGFGFGFWVLAFLAQFRGFLDLAGKFSRREKGHGKIFGFYGQNKGVNGKIYFPELRSHLLRRERGRGRGRGRGEVLNPRCRFRVVRRRYKNNIRQLLLYINLFK